MSTENVIKFLEQVEKNTDLQVKLEAIKTPNELITLAKEQGYEVSADDFKAVKEMANSGEELSEDELEAVAGGGFIRESAALASKYAKKAWAIIW